MGHGSTPSDPWPMWPIRFSWPIWPMTHDPSTHSLLWYKVSIQDAAKLRQRILESWHLGWHFGLNASTVNAYDQRRNWLKVYMSTHKTVTYDSCCNVACLKLKSPYDKTTGCLRTMQCFDGRNVTSIRRTHEFCISQGIVRWHFQVR